MYPLEFARRSHYTVTPGIGVAAVLRSGANVVDLPASIDTGSEFCIFARAYGEDLGLVIESGDATSIGTANGGRFRAFGHEVTLEVLGYSLETTVYFAEDAGFQRNVLGRNGWLNRHRIAIIDHDQLLYVSPYDP